MAEPQFNDYSIYEKTYKNYIKPSLIKNHINNELLSYELYKVDLPPNGNSLKSSYLIKTITFHNKEKLLEFEEFLMKLRQFQKTAKIKGFLKVHETFQKENTIILVQKDHLHLLSDQENNKNFTWNEIDIFNLLRTIIKFYYQMKQEDIFESFVGLSVPLKRLSTDLIFFYEKNHKTVKGSSEDQRYILKIDMMAFDPNMSLEKCDKTTFHLKELELLIQKYFGKVKKLGPCSRNLLRKIDGENLLWRKFLTHPMFKADYDIIPDLTLWKIENADRITNKFEEKKELGHTMEIPPQLTLTPSIKKGEKKGKSPLLKNIEGEGGKTEPLKDEQSNVSKKTDEKKKGGAPFFTCQKTKKGG